MKKIYLSLLASFVFVQFSYAQITTDPSTGNVGIGTTAPVEKTTIAKSDPAALGIYRDLDVNSVGSAGTFLNFGARNGSVFTTGGQVMGVLQSPSDAGNLSFSTRTANVLTTKMLITSEGNVGIGTTNPQSKFHVGSGLSDVIAIGTTDYGGNSGQPLAGIKSGEVPGGYGGSLEFQTLAWGAQPYALTTKMIIQGNSGNVGIGTTNPNGKLDVNGAILLPGSITNTMLRPAVNAARIGGEIAGYSASGFLADDGFLRVSAGGGSNSVKSYIDLSGYSTIPDMNQNITIGTAGAERMRIDATGNVGIGTIDPKGYKLAVAGNMVAEQVTVKLRTNWPDYVFNKDYTLTPLSDVKTYIDQNHHLPEVPSEKEVTEKGLNLGEMNKLLMKKVEELTLYLIEKDKENKAIQLKLATQQEQINSQAEILRSIQRKLKGSNNR